MEIVGSIRVNRARVFGLYDSTEPNLFNVSNETPNLKRICQMDNGWYRRKHFPSQVMGKLIGRSKSSHCHAFLLFSNTVQESDDSRIPSNLKDQHVPDI